MARVIIDTENFGYPGGWWIVVFGVEVFHYGSSQHGRLVECRPPSRHRYLEFESYEEPKAV